MEALNTPKALLDTNSNSVAADSLKGTKVPMEADNPEGGALNMYSRYNDMNDTNQGWHRFLCITAIPIDLVSKHIAFPGINGEITMSTGYKLMADATSTEPIAASG